MDWIRANKTLAAIMGVFLAAAAGVGFLVVKAWLALGESKERFDTTNNSLASMKSADLYPSPENRDKKKAAVEEYEKQVTTLSKVLLSLQPEVQPISETDFQAKLKARIAEVRALAGKSTRLPADFALAFPDYTASLPKSAEVASELSDYLDAADAVARALIESKVESVELFERTPLASETGQPAEPAAPPARQGPAAGKGKGGPARQMARLVERRTLTLSLTCDQGALQNVLNRLASPSQMPHFTAVRLLRIENEKNEGPLRSEVAAQINKNTAPLVEEPESSTEIVISPDGQPAPAASNPNVITPAKPGIQDAVGVLGQEKLKVYLEIDLIRFVNPEAGLADAAPSNQ